MFNKNKKEFNRINYEIEQLKTRCFNLENPKGMFIIDYENPDKYHLAYEYYNRYSISSVPLCILESECVSFKIIDNDNTINIAIKTISEGKELYFEVDKVTNLSVKCLSSNKDLDSIEWIDIK